MTAITVYEGAQAPEQYTLTIRHPGFDFASVVSAEFVVRRPNGERTTWSASISDQSSSQISITHVFSASDLTRGKYLLYARLTTASSGVVRSKTRTLNVKAEFEDG